MKTINRTRITMVGFLIAIVLLLIMGMSKKEDQNSSGYEETPISKVNHNSHKKVDIEEPQPVTVKGKISISIAD